MMKHLLSLFLAMILPLAVQAERDRPGGDRPPGTPRVLLYSGENFDGVSVELRAGEAVPHLGDLHFADGRKVSDRISSIRVVGPLSVTIFSDGGFRGEKMELSGDVPNLKRLRRRGGGSWNNCISSVRVSDWQPPRAGRDEPRRRDEWRDEDCEREIRSAYRELFDRDPDRDELRRCRELAREKDWRREQIRRHLRDSREYRRHEAERLVVRVCRELLDRLPAPPERERWCREIVEHGWTEERLRDEIRHGEEYRRKHHGPPDDRRH